MTHFVGFAVVPNEKIINGLVDEIYLEDKLSTWNDHREIDPPYKRYLSSGDIDSFFHYYNSFTYNALNLLEREGYDISDKKKDIVNDKKESREDKVDRILNAIEELKGKDGRLEIVNKIYKKQSEIGRLTIREFLVKFSTIWSGDPYHMDEKGIFYWSTYNQQSKWDWFVIGGRWKEEYPSYLSITSDMDRDLIKYEEGEIETLDGFEGKILGKVYPSVIIANDKWVERCEWGWWGSHSDKLPIEEWNKTFDDILDSHIGTHTLVQIDFHI